LQGGSLHVVEVINRGWAILQGLADVCRGSKDFAGSGGVCMGWGSLYGVG